MKIKFGDLILADGKTLEEAQQECRRARLCIDCPYDKKPECYVIPAKPDGLDYLVEVPDKVCSELLTIPNSDVSAKAIMRYGADAQVDMAIEEMSELTKALLKLRRKRKQRTGYYEPERDNVAEEVADVLITLWQVIRIEDISTEVEQMIDKKVQRLAERMEKEGRK